MLWLGRNPRIRSRAIRVMQDHPELFAPLLATHTGEETPARLLTTGAQVGLRLLAG
jgi:hypothetical protein